MKIKKIITNPAPPGQLVIIEGDDLATAEKLHFGDKTIPFKVNSTGGMETTIPDGSGTVEVSVEGKDGGRSDSVSFTYLEVH